MVGLGHPDDVRRGRRVQPLSYHNGTVWPDDVPRRLGPGPCRQARRARTLARALFEAAGYFDWSLPEVFAGFSRDETPFPISYPTAARPQAWAAGAPVLLLRLLLGLRPDSDGGSLVSDLPAPVPVGSDRSLTHVPARGRRWNVVLEDGAVHVEEAR